MTDKSIIHRDVVHTYLRRYAESMAPFHAGVDMIARSLGISEPDVLIALAAIIANGDTCWVGAHVPAPREVVGE